MDHLRTLKKNEDLLRTVHTARIGAKLKMDKKVDTETISLPGFPDDNFELLVLCFPVVEYLFGLDQVRPTGPQIVPR